VVKESGIMRDIRRKAHPFWIAYLVGVVSLSCLVVAKAGGSPEPTVNSGESNWPQWRGPTGQGISAEVDLPLTWSDTKNVLWRTPIEGLGHSSPAVWGKKLFLTTAIEGPIVPGAKAVTHIESGEEFVHPDSVGADRSHTFKVLCLASDTGEIIWERIAYQGTVYDARHRKASYASPTPATDGNYVYVYFGSQGLYCYDLDGNLIWKKSFGGIATWGVGTGTSPVLYENSVIVQADEDNGEKSFIAALDKETGEEIWKVARKVQASWATPILVEFEGRTELVTNGNEAIISYDAATGKELWRVKGVESNAIPSPVAGPGMVFVSAGFPRKITKAIKLGGSGDLTDTSNVVWEYEKGTAYVPSTLLYGDHLYLLSDKGILTCLDSKTGKTIYQGGRVPVPAMFKASPVGVDRHILLASEDGDVFVIKAGPIHEVLAVNSIGEPIWASPAISEGRIFLRGKEHLYCIGTSPSS
jgi:outer membrane protein assembly factor BamB